MLALRMLLVAAAGAALVTAGGAWAQETPTEAPPGVNLVEARDVQSLQAKGAVIVNTLRPGGDTIKGAVFAPYDPEKSARDVTFDSALDRFDMSKIDDKNKDYVLFCLSSTCWKSYKAAVVMARAGYKNVHWYRTGIADWKARNLPTE